MENQHYARMHEYTEKIVEELSGVLAMTDAVEIKKEQVGYLANKYS